MDLVTVAVFNNAAAAEMAKNYLTDAGVTSYVEEDATGDMLHLAAPFGEVKLMVATADVDQAAALLKEAEASHAAHEVETDAEIPAEEAEKE